MEPQTCTAWLKPEGFLEVWTSTQNAEASMAAAAEAAGLPLEKVEVHKMMLGGGFGRRGGRRISSDRAWRLPGRCLACR
jgi:isoquinoline 1-oxidoreductase beta subunit